MSDFETGKAPLSVPDLIVRLGRIGMGEYEAKIYVALSTLRVATARELHEVTRIPRTRVYDTLDSLIEDGYVVLLDEHPSRYHVADITATFERIKRRTMSELEELNAGLLSLERERPTQVMRGYELLTRYAVEHQIQMIFQRVKTELIILSPNPEYLNQYAQTILNLRKRAAVYLITRRDADVAASPLPWYTGKKDLEEGLFQISVDEVLLTVIADRHETLLIHTKKDGNEGVFIPNDPRNEYLARKILDDLTQGTR